jgi:exonuclease III
MGENPMGAIKLHTPPLQTVRGDTDWLHDMDRPRSRSLSLPRLREGGTTTPWICGCGAPPQTPPAENPMGEDPMGAIKGTVGHHRTSVGLTRPDGALGPLGTPALGRGRRRGTTPPRMGHAEGKPQREPSRQLGATPQIDYNSTPITLKSLDNCLPGSVAKESVLETKESGSNPGGVSFFFPPLNIPVRGTHTGMLRGNSHDTLCVGGPLCELTAYHATLANLQLVLPGGTLDIQIVYMALRIRRGHTLWYVGRMCWILTSTAGHEATPPLHIPRIQPADRYCPSCGGTEHTTYACPCCTRHRCTQCGLAWTGSNPNQGRMEMEVSARDGAEAAPQGGGSDATSWPNITQKDPNKGTSTKMARDRCEKAISQRYSPLQSRSIDRVPKIAPKPSGAKLSDQPEVQEVRTHTQGVLESMSLPKGLRRHVQIQIGFAGLSRTPIILNNPHLTLLGILRAHEANGYLNMVWRCPALKDPVFRQAYIWLVQHGWLPRLLIQHPPLTRAALARILIPPAKREGSCAALQLWSPSGSFAFLGAPETNPQLTHQQTLVNRAHQWYLTREQRNALARAYNGNTAPGYRATKYPHRDLPELDAETEEKFKRQHLTIFTHNGCTLQPKPVLMSKLMNSAPRTPDVVVMAETHHTPHTMDTGKALWRSNKMQLHVEKKSATANGSSGVAIATASAMAACKIISHDPMGRHLAVLIPLARGLKILLIGVYAPQNTEPRARRMLADQILRLLEMARNQRHAVILSGDWNDIQDTTLDRFPQLENPSPPDPWFADLIHNPYVDLYDPWRLHHPTGREYTYYHPGDTMRDRKDFSLVSEELVDCVTWTTNALWPIDPQNRKGDTPP